MVKSSKSRSAAYSCVMLRKLLNLSEPQVFSVFKIKSNHSFNVFMDNLLNTVLCTYGAYSLSWRHPRKRGIIT